MPHRFIEFAGHFGKRFFGVPDPLFSQGGRRYMYKYLLFDLDGTITKSEEGIFNCIKYALDWAGIPYPEYRVFRSFIGPSLYDSFVREFGMDDAKAKEMVAKYRERYNVVGLFEAEVYDGVADTLCALKEKGCILSVATSKPTEPTLRILEKFGVGKYFDVVVGSNPDGTGSDKKHIISQVLESLKKDHGLTEDMIKSNQVVMIGDRRYDIEGGKACGLQTIGVLYGYGSREEFEAAGADNIVESPEEILNL
jgi:phosphoglycolate phosphatase